MNACQNKLIFFGTSEKISAFYDVLKRVMKEPNCRPSTLLTLLELELPALIDRHVEFDSIGEYQEENETYAELTANVITGYGPNDPFFDVLCEKYNINYTSSSVTDESEYYIHNDLDYEYFPNNILVDIWDDIDGHGEGYNFFENEVAAKEYLEKRFGELSSTEKDLDAWNTYISEVLEIGKVIIAIRD